MRPMPPRRPWIKLRTNRKRRRTRPASNWSGVANASKTLRVLGEITTMCIQRILLATAFCATSLLATPQASDSTAQPDNTKVNQRDRNADQPTADQQKNDHSDRMLTKNIRKSIMADKSLSTYAHNVKIISQNGTVTLKGPVKSEDEKKSVLAKAAEIVGSPDKVTDEVSVKQ